VHPSDLAPALVAHEARVAIHGPEGERVIPLARFFTLPSEGDVTRENVLRPNEVLTRVEVPAPAAGTRGTYLKFKERDSFDFALASVALLLRLDGGRVAAAKLCLGGVAPVPWRCEAAGQALAGQPAGDATWRAAAEAAVRGAQPLAHNAYKVPLAKGLVVKALRALATA
jgi:xanthine dehydrogenase YagS FAD-binding subunit